MEGLFKRYFWVVNLLVLTVLAFLSAKVVTNWMTGEIAALETRPNVDAPVVKATVGSRNSSRDLAETVLNRNLFNANPPEPEETHELTADGETEIGGAISGICPGPNDPCEAASSSSLSVKATMVAEPSEWSMAIVDDGETQGNRLARIGMAFGDQTLCAIHRNRIVLGKGKKFECIELGAKRGRGRKKKTRSRSTAKSGTSIKDGVKKTGKNSYDVDREMLDEQLNDLSKLGRQARVIPHYRDGKPQGFKIVGVRPGSLYSHIGLRSGDILKGVNDTEISSPNKALELFEQLKSSSNVQVQLERRGRKINLDYTIK